MNGCLLFIIIIYLWLRAQQTSQAAVLRFSFWSEVESSLRRRDYRLEGFPYSTRGEEALVQTLRLALKQGLVQGERLSYIGKAFADSQKLHERGRRTLNILAAHLLLTLLLGLSLRLLLERQLLLNRDDLGAFSLACLILAASLWIIFQRWPRAWTADPIFCQAFVASCLRLSNEGPWKASLQKAEAQAWREGSDPELVLRSLLDQVLIKENSRVEAGFNWVDELIGPVELFFSLIMIAIFCSDSIGLLFIHLSLPMGSAFIYAVPARIR